MQHALTRGKHWPPSPFLRYVIDLNPELFLTGSLATGRLRSVWSGRFEIRMRSIALPELSLTRSRFEADARIQEFLPKMAIAEPDPENDRLDLKFVGAGLVDYFDADPTGANYLNLVDNSVRSSALASALWMVTRPCGLWQLTPAQAEDGQLAFLEYTILPLLHDEAGRSQLAVYVHRSELLPSIKLRLAEAQRSTLWSWIDIGFGLPTPGTSADLSNPFDRIRAEMISSGFVGAAALSDQQIADGLHLFLNPPPDTEVE